MTGRALALVAVLLPAAASAQGDGTGSIAGYVFDLAGNPLAGVTVRISSPTQIGERRATTTRSDGSFRLAGLAPGVFALDASAPRMATYHQVGIHVGLGTAEVFAILGPDNMDMGGPIVESGSIIRADTARVTGIFESDYVETLPLRSREGVHLQLVDEVPGGIDGRIRGGRARQTLFLQDGFELDSQPAAKAAAAFEVGLGGYGAEGVDAPGGVLNLVTRSGSNHLEAELEASTEGGRDGSGFHHVLAPLVAGRILKNRLWFMATDELHFIEEATGTELRRRFVHKGTLKLTWQPSTRHRLASITDVELPDWQHEVTPGTESEVRHHQARRLFTGLIHDALLTDDLSLRTQVGLLRARDDDDRVGVQGSSSLRWFILHPRFGKHDLSLRERLLTEAARDELGTAHLFRHTVAVADAWKPTLHLTVIPSLAHAFVRAWNIRGDRPIDRQALAPGLGLAWDPTHDGRTILRASHGQ
ncbi:MAG TPA: TonB-dependent receptor, partial [Polyangia bacterium]|nr:TonB-dependent receptor [Polyangia bacterium]